MELEEREAARVSFVLASQLLYGEPQAQTLAAYTEGDLFAGAPFGAGDEALDAGLAAMRAWCLEAAHALDDPQAFAALVDDLKADWFQLIAGAGVPKAPSWAGYYLATNSQILSEETLPVRRLYARWGFELARKNCEPDDDLGVMLGFMAYLMGVEAAEPAGSPRAQAALVDQQELLLERILPWICAWRYSMAKYARSSFYRGAGDYVFGLLRAYAVRFDVAYNPSGTPSYWTVRA